MNAACRAVVAVVVATAINACGGSPTGSPAGPSTVPALTTTTGAATPPAAPVATVPATTAAVPSTAAVAVPAAVVPSMPVAVRSGADVSPDSGVGDPLSISIDSISVESELVPAGLLEDGTVDVPADPFIAGWFTGGPRPGDRGPAVIMGHVDSKKSGPGVFWHLVDLAVGAVVTIETTTGTVVFVVDHVDRFPKDEFPTEAVYGPTPRPTLRLITCGGTFDRSIGHYRDNVVAFLVEAPAGVS
jgi:hypothetical protein